MKIKCPVCGCENYFSGLEDEETRFCSSCNEPLFKIRKEKPISEFSNTINDFSDRLSRTFNCGIIEDYWGLLLEDKEAMRRFPYFSRKDIQEKIKMWTINMIIKCPTGLKLKGEETRCYCIDCYEPLSKFKIRKEKPISEFSNTINDFNNRLSRLVKCGIFEIYVGLLKELTHRFPNLSRKDICLLAAFLTNELFMSSQNQKRTILSVKQANKEFLSREINNVLRNKEKAEAIALILRLKGSIFLSEESADGLIFLERAKEIDPQGRVPNGEEIVKLFNMLGI